MAESVVAQSPVHADANINDIMDVDFLYVQAADGEPEKVGVKRVLLQSPEKGTKKAKTTPSPTKAKRPNIKTPNKGTKATNKSAKKSTPKTPKSGSKTSNTASANKNMTTATKKKKMAALEAQEEAIKQSLDKLRKEKSKQQAKLTKLEENQAPAEPMPKSTTQDIFTAYSSVLDTFSRAENFFPTEAVDDAITIWNFFNTFSKQLQLTQISWEDFSSLLNYSGRASAALADLYCAPLRLILSDTRLRQKLNASLPKRAHVYKSTFGSSDNYKDNNNDSAENDIENKTIEQLAQSFTNSESFDHEYNGFKFFAHRLSVDSVDSLRWQVILRSVLLRLEPVKQLRRAVLEIAIAFDLLKRQRLSDANNKVLQSTAKLAKVLAVGTTPRKKVGFDSIVNQNISNNNIDCNNTNNSSNNVTAKAETVGTVTVKSETTAGVLPLNKEVLDKVINTPYKVSSLLKKKHHNYYYSNNNDSENNNSISNSTNNNNAMLYLTQQKYAFNRDAIFGMSTNYTLLLDRIAAAAVALETKEVHSLSVGDKLIVLRTLCEACYDTVKFMELLETNADERANQLTLHNKKLKEAKLQKKEVSQAKREIAVKNCKELMSFNNNANNTTGNATNNKKKAKTGSNTASNSEPSNEMVSNMVEDLIILEEYNVHHIVPDFVLEEISDDENGTNDDSDEELLVDNINNKRRRSNNNQSLSRAEARELKRLKDEMRYRNDVIEQAQNKLLDALADRSEKALRSAIRNAERAKMRFKNPAPQAPNRVSVTMTLKNAYKALYEYDLKAKEEKAMFAHEKRLEEYFVRTEAMGCDRFGNLYFRFATDEHRLFVQLNPLNNNASSNSNTLHNNSVVSSNNTNNSNVSTMSVLQRLFVSRPGRVPRHNWRIYSSQSELWRVASCLYGQIECEKQLKMKLIAAYDLQEPAVEFVTDGHPYIGRRVTRRFGRKTVVGVIVGWAAAVNDDVALWRVMHSDGDEEDLEEHEVIESLIEDDNEENEDEGNEENDWEEEAENEDNEEEDEEEEVGEGGEEEEEFMVVDGANNKEQDNKIEKNGGAKDASKKNDDEDAEFDLHTNNRTNLTSKASTTSLSTSGGQPAIEPPQDEPRLVKNQNGLARYPRVSPNNLSHVASVLLNPPGINGLKLELSRFFAQIYDNLKKRGNTKSIPVVIDRDIKRSLEVSLRHVETLEEVKQFLLSLEELIYQVQTVEDLHEDDEMAKQRALKVEEMKTEGWLFNDDSENTNEEKKDEQQGNFGAAVVGRKARRFFKGFGVSDGFIYAYLPPEKNDGFALYRMLHNDGDEEDLDEKDLCRAIDAFARDMNEEEAKKVLLTERKRLNNANITNNENNSENNENNDKEEVENETTEISSESETDESSDSDNDETNDDEERNGFPALRKRFRNDMQLNDDLRRLWPTQEVRQRWIDSLSQSQTLGETAMAVSLLEEVSFCFGVLHFAERDDNSNSLLFKPSSFINYNTNINNNGKNNIKNNNNYNNNSKNVKNNANNINKSRTNSNSSFRNNNNNNNTGFHRMLSPRKAKKYALGEIARQSRYNAFDDVEFDNNLVDYEVEDEEVSEGRRRRSSRNNTNNNIAVLYDENGTLCNSNGRPSRSAALKIASYAE